ncbi:hypothetical protein GGTG_13941 [Gaeumannomyces tritici R3-111a-1]|uniref:Uncharacterized protein n=1 Tax=Gaeumannomyces tritici (strain R3-111a-1) TaxID=644352 RepID=J3PK92_GAET3|nr:hypothetical protein GGTG_13941 [Gaeumannomyces tritici R3-111a-1]EJT68481.1 hypothetical protein GGTG_13941 [Gaeumannomyces tritici R3-111a-1]
MPKTPRDPKKIPRRATQNSTRACIHGAGWACWARPLVVLGGEGALREGHRAFDCGCHGWLAWGWSGRPHRAFLIVVSGLLSLQYGQPASKDIRWSELDSGLHASPSWPVSRLTNALFASCIRPIRPPTLN